MTRIRLVVAGAGAFGREHLTRLAAMEEVELVGVADVRAAAAGEAARNFSIPQADTDAAAIIDRLRPDGVVVATAAASHVPLGCFALSLGIPVLIEKPVAISLAEIRELRQAEAASKAFVQPGHILRFYGGPRQLIDIVRSGAVGNVLTILSRRLRDVGHVTRYSDIDPVLMTMIHDIDLALWISGGEAIEVHAVRVGGGGPGTATTALVRDDRGIAWQLWTAWTFPEDSVPADRIEIVGSKGGIELELGSHLTVYGASPMHIDLTSEGEDDPLRLELDCFVEAIRKGKPTDVVTSADAEHGLAVAEAILTDLSRQKAVP